MHYILLDEKHLEGFSDKRIKCLINEVIEIHSALMKKKEGDFYINIGSSVLKKLNLKEGDSINVKLFKDETDHQFEMPLELAQELQKDFKVQRFSRV